jgi:predicted NAD-dependent protein-ADP-ribosyltransferase YbiA (DUF1768 family)
MDELLENLEQVGVPVESIQELITPAESVKESVQETPEPEANAQTNAGTEEAEAPEAEAPEAKPKVKKQRQIPIPKDSATFFRARAKDPKNFKFTADGDLQVPEMRGEAPKVIKLPFYRPATADEIRETEEAQMDELKGVEREIDEIAKQLRDAIVEWRTTGAASDVIQYQRDLQRLDAQRTQLRSPVRWTKIFKNLSIRDVLVEQTHEVKKLGYPVEALRMRGITFEKMVRSSEAPFPSASASASASAEASEDEEEETFVVFYSAADPEHGLLSPDTMVEFVFNSTKYNSLLQAYQTERVTTLGRKELRAAILKSRSAAQMRIIGSKVVGQVEDPRALWINILKSLISQHPRFGDAVAATGDATLVFADPRDGVLGIGMPVEDPQVTDREAWKGTNLLGQAWQAVRTSLKEMAVEPQKGGSFTEHGTTAEEAKQTRSRVLMGRYRRKA